MLQRPPKVKENTNTDNVIKSFNRKIAIAATVEEAAENGNVQDKSETDYKLRQNKKVR